VIAVLDLRIGAAHVAEFLFAQFASDRTVTEFSHVACNGLPELPFLDLGVTERTVMLPTKIKEQLDGGGVPDEPVFIALCTNINKQYE